MAIPKKDSLLVPFSTNWNTRVVATPVVFGLTAAQATAYTALHDPYIAAYTAASVPGSRSRSLVTAKDNAKSALLFYARELYAFVQANTAVADADKVLLGVTVRAEPAPQPVPPFAPAVDILSAIGRTVRIRLHDSTDASRRGKPPFVKGAAVFSYVGNVAPTDPALFKFEGNTTRTIFDVVFPDSVAPGTTVWICGMWFNDRAQSGPGCAPVNTNLPGGAMMAA